LLVTKSISHEQQTFRDDSRLRDNNTHCSVLSFQPCVECGLLQQCMVCVVKNLSQFKALVVCQNNLVYCQTFFSIHPVAQ